MHRTNFGGTRGDLNRPNLDGPDKFHPTHAFLRGPRLFPDPLLRPSEKKKKKKRWQHAACVLEDLPLVQLQLLQQITPPSDLRAFSAGNDARRGALAASPTWSQCSLPTRVLGMRGCLPLLRHQQTSPVKGRIRHSAMRQKPKSRTFCEHPIQSNHSNRFENGW